MGEYIAEIPDERILNGCCYVPDERDEPIPVEKCSDWMANLMKQCDWLPKWSHIIEEEETGTPVCANCGAIQPEDYTVYYCWNCGAKFSPSKHGIK